jgi:molecular chaperone GrpE
MNSKEELDLIDEFGPAADVNVLSGNMSTPVINAPKKASGFTVKVESSEPEQDAAKATATAALETELAETKDRLYRLAADYENFKKRRQREKEELQYFANERLLKDLLPVMDNLERALESARTSDQARAITAGLELVLQEFSKVLTREGVEAVPSVGQPFDPSLQEALQAIETNEFAPGTVASEILKGYKVYGRVLRAALVGVACEPQDRN